jgi:hypothetical protein
LVISGLVSGGNAKIKSGTHIDNLEVVSVN